MALGANLGRCAETFNSVIAELDQQVAEVRAVSRYFISPALVPEKAPAQPDYLNAVLLCRSLLAAHDLLKQLLQIERRFGRDRSTQQRWQPRTIDLDIISYGDFTCNQADLVLPHPEMHKRRFVLEPLCDIAPNWKHPILGHSALELLSNLS